MSKAMWSPVLEKAWAKVKGSYEIAGSGGLTSNGMRAILGIPVLILTSQIPLLRTAFLMN